MNQCNFYLATYARAIRTRGSERSDEQGFDYISEISGEEVEVGASYLPESELCSYQYCSYCEHDDNEHIESDNIVESTPSSSASQYDEHDEKDYGLYCNSQPKTSNEERVRVKSLKQTVLIIVAPARTIRFRLSGAEKYRAALNIIPGLLRQAKDNDQAKDELEQKARYDLEQTCEALLPKKPYYEEHDGSKDKQDEVRYMECLAAACMKMGWSHFRERVPYIIAIQAGPQRFDKFADFINTNGIHMHELGFLEHQVPWAKDCITQYNALKGTVSTLRASSLRPEALVQVEKWYKNMLEEVIAAEAEPTSTYGSSLALIAKDCDNDLSEWIATKDLTDVDDKSPLGHFILSFYQGNGGLHLPSQRLYLERAIDQVWRIFEGPDDRVNKQLLDLITVSKVGRLLDLTAQFSTIKLPQALNILTNLLPLSPTRTRDFRDEYDSDDFEARWLPLTRMICHHEIPCLNDPKFTEDLAHFVMTVLHRYIVVVVQDKPQEPTHWGKGVMGCKLPPKDCRSVTQFLVDKRIEKKDFVVAKPHVDHLDDCFTKQPNAQFTVTKLDRDEHTIIWRCEKHHFDYQKWHVQWSKAAKKAKFALMRLNSSGSLLRKFLGPNLNAVMSCQVEHLPTLEDLKARRVPSQLPEVSRTLVDIEQHRAALLQPPKHDVDLVDHIPKNERRKIASMARRPRGDTDVSRVVSPYKRQTLESYWQKPRRLVGQT